MGSAGVLGGRGRAEAGRSRARAGSQGGAWAEHGWGHVPGVNVPSISQEFLVAALQRQQAGAPPRGGALTFLAPFQEA